LESELSRSLTLVTVRHSFEGAISTRVIHHAARAFAFEVTFRLDHERLIALGSQKPPLHFHPYQAEYVKVLEGQLVVEVGGREHVLSSGDGEFGIQPWLNHRLFPPPPKDPAGASDGHKITRFLLSGQETRRSPKLDLVFFENWYAYQDQIVLRGRRVDMIQLLCVSTTQNVVFEN
jgi:hypothetical protein